MAAFSKSRNRMEPLGNRLPDWIDLEKARTALKVGTGKKALRIAIIDSGVRRATQNWRVFSLQMMSRFIRTG